MTNEKKGLIVNKHGNDFSFKEGTEVQKGVSNAWTCSTTLVRLARA